MRFCFLSTFTGLLGLGLLLVSLAPANAQLFETKAAQAFMIDAETGTVLFSKDADRLIPPASLAKLMTMEVVFNAIKSGRMTLDDTFVVSENAWRNGRRAVGNVDHVRQAQIGNPGRGPDPGRDRPGCQ